MSCRVLKVEGQGKNADRTCRSVGSECVDSTSSEKEVDMNMEAQYESDAEPDEAGRKQKEATADNRVGTRESNVETKSRNPSTIGRWGSSFWKDCQPMCPQNGSESGPESKSESDYRNADESEDHSLEGRGERLVSVEEDGQEDSGKGQRGHSDVPAEEMLSDEYYEQDGEEQSDSMHGRGFRRSTGSNSCLQWKSTNVNRRVHRKSRILDDSEDDDGDADYEEDEADEDDPDDADFEPATSCRGANKDKDWEGEDSDEADDSDEDIDVWDNDGSYLDKKAKGRQRGKFRQSVRPTRDRKACTASSRQRRVQASFEDEDDDSTAEDSDSESDEDFTSLKKRRVHVLKNNVRSSAPTSSYRHSNEVRSSTRTVRKVSYVESDESEAADEGKKSQKEEIEEDDGDSIEKVLWHQPKGTAAEALENNQSMEPVLMSRLFDSEPDWNNEEFLIKWKGQSHLHCQWKSFIELQNLTGFKKVLNYTKRVTEEIRYRMRISREEIEINDVSKEMDIDIIKQNSQVERIISDRICKDNSGNVIPEYLVKWQGLSYAEVTWEKDIDIAFAQHAIDEYKAREAAMSVQGKTVDLQRRKGKASLRKLDEQPEWLKSGKLRDYQLEGLNFLVNSWINDTNVVLADEMGLGKTVQSVSMLGFLQNTQQIHGPFLVVVPLSTLSNWAKEFRKWLPNMSVIVYVGTRSSREVCQQYEFYNENKAGKPIKFNTLLTTYEVVLKDKAVLSKIKWNYLMVDEAHRLKNSEAQLYTALSEFNTKNKLLITGTPLQNSVEELWALLHFLDSDKFKSKDEFVQNYKNLSSFNENELANLHMELRPHMLRRIIKDVEKSLPPKIERILRVDMSPLQKQYYKWILERNFHDLNKGVRGNQMVRMLDILAQYLSLRGFQFQRLDGSTKSELRQQAMEHFNAPGSDDFCFLLSTRAGGLGINLATADTVIIFDSDWNPQNDLQAMSRAHRIGQQEVVNIYRFVTSKSVEEDILERAKKKMVLDHLVIQKLNAEGKLEKKEAKKGGSFFDKNELSAILRFGAEELFKEERNDEESKKRLLSMDIDEILERAEKVEEKENEGEQAHELLSAFKVANFCNDEDDGSFWSRWIKADAVAQAENALAPRAARYIKSYAENDQFERSNKRIKKESEPPERIPKRRKAEHSAHVTPMIDGASAQVRSWSYGNLSKRDALRFSRSVVKFGNESQINLIAAEVGGAVDAAPPKAQAELFNALIDGCREAVEVGSLDLKGPLLDFYGVPVKANELLIRVQELQLLARRISRYEDPVAQFRVLTYLKPSNWSKGCGWNQIDDARLLLGVHYHGIGNWEMIRLDERLGLTKKIAPVELQHHETFLPRAPNLRDRANALLEQELAVLGVKNAYSKVGKKTSKKEKEHLVDISLSRGQEKKKNTGSYKVNVQMRKDRLQKPLKVEPIVKEEGEMSDDDEEVYEQFKEVKWLEWCQDVMVEEGKTLQRLQRLQRTSADLPKEKVLSKIRNYLQLLGRRIDHIVSEQESEPYKQNKMATRLWEYASTFSHLSGERLHQIYSKLKMEQNAAGVGPSLPNGNTNNSYSFPRHRERQRGLQNGTAYQMTKPTNETSMSEAWKRRRRAENNGHGHFQGQPPPRRVTSNGIRPLDTNSMGILGAGPSDKHLAGEKPFKTRPGGCHSRQEYSPEIE
ncbi:protein CHROMATIN REMODELING 5 isoform X4 [Lathyrus oleraceus]|uniref:protein CHROMATIN REMODELING 5 isoform X4 n=1 Tax=Pisum sativum TaxID=3888 RepID=UPI0021D1EB30|nr:protein CHROMATIN REMODELING 5-like isoform X4 [Pisum sativum]